MNCVFPSLRATKTKLGNSENARLAESVISEVFLILEKMAVGKGLLKKRRPCGAGCAQGQELMKETALEFFSLEPLPCTIRDPELAELYLGRVTPPALRQARTGAEIQAIPAAQGKILNVEAFAQDPGNEVIRMMVTPGSDR